MRQKSSLQVLGSITKQPFFTSKESRLKGISPSVLAYYVKTGDLERIARGVYRSACSPFPSIDRWTDLAEAAYLIPDSAICLLSALAIYGLTEEIPRQHWIAIRHGTSALRNRRVKIIRLRNMELGKITIRLGGMTVSIFDRERTVVDAFRLLSPEIAIKALKAGLTKRGKNKLNSKKLEEYAKKLRYNITPYLLSATL